MLPQSSKNGARDVISCDISVTTENLDPDILQYELPQRDDDIQLNTQIRTIIVRLRVVYKQCDLCIWM